MSIKAREVILMVYQLPGAITKIYIDQILLGFPQILIEKILFPVVKKGKIESPLHKRLRGIHKFILWSRKSQWLHN